MMDPAAVVFDMDGVLVDTFEYHYQSWKKIAGLHGISFTRQDNRKLLGLTRRRSLEVIFDGQLPDEPVVQELLWLKNHYYLEYVKTMSAGNLAPGVLRLLEELKQAGVRMAVASASRNVKTILEQLGIASYFLTLTDGNEITRSKPAPDVFLQAACRLGVEPGACMALEDSQAGVIAAGQAGMCVVALGPAARLQLAGASFPDLSQVGWAELCAVYRQWQAGQGAGIL